MPRARGQHYVDKQRLAIETNEWKFKRDEWKARKLEAETQSVDFTELEPRLPEYVGHAILKIASKYVMHPKFFRIPLKEREELVSCGVLAGIKGLRNNYKPEKMETGSPFSFLTTAVHFGFLAEIKKSKKFFDSKNAYTESFCDGQVADAMYQSKGSDHKYHSSQLNEVRSMLDQYKEENEEDSKFDKLDYAGAHAAKVKLEKERLEQEKLELLNKHLEDPSNSLTEEEKAIGLDV